MSKIKKIKGFADLFPPESDAFRFLETVAREVFGSCGYGELRTPILEKTEVFAKGIGEETDVVGKEMYTFPDRKGRSLTMRPEGTAGIVRAFAEHAGRAPGNVSKYYMFGPMFRYERPQKGRMRQFHQLDAEIFGTEAPAADAELMLMLSRFLGELGLENLTFEVNSLGCKECRPDYKKALQDFLQKLDVDKLCENCKRRMETNPLRVLDCKVPACKELVEGAPNITEHLCDGCQEHFDAVLAIVDAAGLEYVLNPRLVRGLDYYVRTAFEVVSNDIGAQGSVAGGGRYDGLVKKLGGPDVPGVGFACGMERLALLLEGIEEERNDFYIAVLDERAVGDALLFAEMLRVAGQRGITDFEAGSFKSRLRLAGKLNVDTCLIIGSDEYENDTVLVKNMETGDQETVSRLDYIKTVGKQG